VPVPALYINEHMTPHELVDLTAMITDAAILELGKKSVDYAPEGIVFIDIVRQAAQTNVLPEQLLWIMMQKHLTALRTFAQTGKLSSESLLNRTIDTINYAAFICIWASNSVHILRDIRSHFVGQPCECPRPLATETMCDRCQVLVWFERYRVDSRMVSIFEPV